VSHGSLLDKRKKKWRAFRSARKFIRSLNLKNDSEWRQYCKGECKHLDPKPDDIPTTPNIIYKDKGWVNLGDWLGTGKLSNKDISLSYRPFRSARKFVRALGLQNREEWQTLHRKGKVPKDIPLKPERAYASKGWVSCGDWFGTGYIPPSERTYRSFKDARLFSRHLGLKSRREWEAYSKDGLRGKPKLPSDIPATPARIYKAKGWKGWPDWLGKS
jgi:hypothetical protein